MKTLLIAGMTLLTTMNGAFANTNGKWMKYVEAASTYAISCVLVHEEPGKTIMITYGRCDYKNPQQWKATGTIVIDSITGDVTEGVSELGGKICDKLKVVKRDASISFFNYCQGTKLPNGDIEPLRTNFILAADEIVCTK